MSITSFPVAWQSGPHRFVGKAYVKNGQLNLTGASTGVARRRRTLRLDGCDIIGVATCRVAGQPGLAVEHSFGLLELEVLAGSWGAARELADAVATTAGPALVTSPTPYRGATTISEEVQP
jgi:hypothetical protein